MRETFHGDLDQITDDLLELCRLVQVAIERSTAAILDADVQVADQVIADDHIIDARRHGLDALAVELLARQAPVATDLRRIVTAMRMSSDLERMGDLARHVAKVTRLRYPESAIPADQRATIASMGEVGSRIARRVADVIAARDVIEAREVQTIDDELDSLHRDLYGYLSGGDYPHGAASAVDMALLGRYYERFGDHAVSVARRVHYMVTGELDGLPDADESDELV